MPPPFKIGNDIPGQDGWQHRRPGDGDFKVIQRPHIPPKGGSGDTDKTTPPPSLPTSRTVREPREITINGSARGLPIPVILGKQRIGAQITYANSFNNNLVLYLVAVHCHGPVQSITPRVDNHALTNAGSYWTDGTGLIQVWNYDGSQTAIDSASALTAWDPQFDEYYSGLAYSII